MILVAGGMVITAVGLGDKGFKSVELRLLGPVIVLTGLTLIFIRLNIKHFICGVENSVRELLKRWRMFFWLEYPTLVLNGLIDPSLQPFVLHFALI